MDLQRLTSLHWIKILLYFDFLDKGNEIHLIYLDFYNASDSIPQGKLLAKQKSQGLAQEF